MEAEKVPKSQYNLEEEHTHTHTHLKEKKTHNMLSKPGIEMTGSHLSVVSKKVKFLESENGKVVTIGQPMRKMGVIREMLAQARKIWLCIMNTFSKSNEYYCGIINNVCQYSY